MSKVEKVPKYPVGCSCVGCVGFVCRFMLFKVKVRYMKTWETIKVMQLKKESKS